MKKQIFFILLIVATATTFAQNPIGKGQKQFNAGLGFSSWGLPIYLGMDFGVHQDITLGGELSFRSYNEKYFNHSYSHTIIGISGNGNYHFNRILKIPSEWDFYAGLNVGFYIWSSSSDYHGGNASGLGLGGQIGGRYYFSKKLGLNIEFGGGNAFSGGKIGISVKL